MPPELSLHPEPGPPVPPVFSITMQMNYTEICSHISGPMNPVSLLPGPHTNSAPPGPTSLSHEPFLSHCILEGCSQGSEGSETVLHFIFSCISSCFCSNSIFIISRKPHYLHKERLWVFFLIYIKIQGPGFKSQYSKTKHPQ